MELFKWNRLLAVQVKLLSPVLWPMHVHWINRTLLCPGEDICPACQHDRREWRGYSLARVKHGDTLSEPCLVELVPAIWSMVGSNLTEHGDLNGVAWAMTRRGKNWMVTQVRRREPETTPEGALPEAMDRLFRMPGSLWTETDIREWRRRRIGPMKNKILIALNAGGRHAAKLG